METILELVMELVLPPPLKDSLINFLVSEHGRGYLSHGNLTEIQNFSSSIENYFMSECSE